MSRKSWKSGYWGSDGNDPEALAWGPYDTPEQARRHPSSEVDESECDVFAFRIDWSEADDPAPHQAPLSPKERERLDRLERRAAHLDERVSGNPALTFDLAERSALRWAIRKIEHYASLPAAIQRPGRGSTPLQGRPGETGSEPDAHSTDGNSTKTGSGGKHFPSDAPGPRPLGEPS